MDSGNPNCWSITFWQKHHLQKRHPDKQLVVDLLKIMCSGVQVDPWRDTIDTGEGVHDDGVFAHLLQHSLIDEERLSLDAFRVIVKPMQL